LYNEDSVLYFDSLLSHKWNKNHKTASLSLIIGFKHYKSYSVLLYDAWVKLNTHLVGRTVRLCISIIPVKHLCIIIVILTLECYVESIITRALHIALECISWDSRDSHMYQIVKCFKTRYNGVGCTINLWDGMKNNCEIVGSYLNYICI